MRSSFLALIDCSGSEGDQKAQQIAALIRERTDLIPVIETSALILFADPATNLTPLQFGAGVVIGTLFARRGGSRRIDTLSDRDTSMILASRGQDLVEDFWGGYTAFLAERGSPKVEIVQSPTGGAGCYYWRMDEMTIVSSDVGLAADCGLLNTRPDLDAIAGHLLAPQLRTARTALSGVTELLGGFRLCVTPAASELTQLWSPWTFADRHALITDETTAIKTVRETTLDAVGAWASSVKHPLLMLSGGLDSSIVAAALKANGRPFSCLTIATTNASGDERDYARTVTDHLDAPLSEAFFDVARVDVTRSEAAHLPRPLARSFAQELDRLNLEAGARVGADSFFNGGGGDSVFCYIQSVSPIIDRLRVEGVGSGAWRTLNDVCRLTGADLWTVCRNLSSKLRAGTPAYRWGLDERFLPPGMARSWSPVDAHRWLETLSDALPGQATHIALILQILNHLEGYRMEQVAPMISPLMSQPLVEQSLRIATWLWCSGGRNRNVTRQAFADDLPELIIKRTSKGTPDSFVAMIYEANRLVLRDMLLGGHLASQGLLDLKALANVLDDRQPVHTLDFVRILTLADVEAWVRAWTTRRPGPLFPRSCGSPSHPRAA